MQSLLCPTIATYYILLVHHKAYIAQPTARLPLHLLPIYILVVPTTSTYYNSLRRYYLLHTKALLQPLTS
jgi:hypothetical protein